MRFLEIVYSFLSLSWYEQILCGFCWNFLTCVSKLRLGCLEVHLDQKNFSEKKSIFLFNSKNERKIFGFGLSSFGTFVKIAFYMFIRINWEKSFWENLPFVYHFWTMTGTISAFWFRFFCQGCQKSVWCVHENILTGSFCEKNSSFL